MPPAPNVDPIYPKTPNVGFDSVITQALNAANITGGVVGTDVGLIFTAGALGSWVEEVKVKPAPGTNTAASVIRLWLNNGSTIATAANSVLFDEMTLPATTTSTTSAQQQYTLPVKKNIPAGYKIYYTLAADPGATNYAVSCWGGDY